MTLAIHARPRSSLPHVPSRSTALPRVIEKRALDSLSVIATDDETMEIVVYVPAYVIVRHDTVTRTDVVAERATSKNKSAFARALATRTAPFSRRRRHSNVFRPLV